MSLRPLQGCNEDFTLCLKLGDLSSGQFSLGLGGNDTIFCPPNKVIIASDDLCRGQVWSVAPQLRHATTIHDNLDCWWRGLGARLRALALC